MLPALDATAAGRGDSPDFATLDADGDGSLTTAELAAHGAERFTSADTDGDGVLTEAELTASAESDNAERVAKMVERMLEHLDENDDGSISADELPDTTERAERMISRADANDDGTVSAEEFEEARPERGGRRGGGRDGDRDGGKRGHGPRGDAASDDT
jgi:Ca2+-binding EF-hand superfamily protein